MRPIAVIAFVCSLGGVAWAQVPPPADQQPPVVPPEPTPPAPTPTTTTTTTTTAGQPAKASDDEAPLGSAVGVGIQAMLSGMYGPAFVYNGGRFHIEGLLVFKDVDGGSEVGFGGHGWFHVHESPRACLSVGGGIGFYKAETDAVPPLPKMEESDIFLEGGAQVRFFVTRNVALNASLGLSITSGDSDVISVVGELTGGAGLTYFIF